MFNVNIYKILINFFNLVLFQLLVWFSSQSIIKFILFGIIFLDLYCDCFVYLNEEINNTDFINSRTL